MDISGKLSGLGLSSENAVVIGSGILNALGIRQSNDVDVVVTEDEWDRLRATGVFDIVRMHGQDVLKAGDVEIARGWNVLGNTWTFEDLADTSVVVGGARYISLEFLLTAKRGWVADGSARPKDHRDIELMEDYLSRQTHPAG